jgi:hypothetical protein
VCIYVMCLFYAFSSSITMSSTFHACHLFLILRSKLVLSQRGVFPRYLQTKSSSLFFVERSYVRTSVPSGDYPHYPSLKSIATYPCGASFHVPSLHFNTLYLHRIDFFPSQGNASEESAYHVPGGVLDPANIHP